MDSNNDYLGRLKVKEYQDKYKEVYPERIKRPLVFFDITIDDVYVGRIIFELFKDVVPKTCENFRRLCICKEKYHGYYKTPFHRIIPNYVAHGGDITRHDGRGGLSIYGPHFDDENFRAKHSIEGLLTMANRGPNTNNSQFMITLFPCPWLDGKHVVFGRVLSGYEVCRKIEECGSELGKPKRKVIIDDCGEISETISFKFDQPGQGSMV